jgi:hypothetical protein
MQGLEAIDSTTATQFKDICLKHIPNTKLRGY